ncbi:6937_t:CDS:2, partial [Gigaspora margarita]
ANASYLSDEAIKDIKTSFGRVPDAINTMEKKYCISVSQAKEYIENKELSDLSTISDTKLEQVLNEGEKQIE